MSERNANATDGAAGPTAMPDLAELCRLHDVGIDLIERSHDVDDLLDKVLEEYERRLTELPADAFDSRGGAVPGPVSGKIRALVMFATQAAALKARAASATEMRLKSERLEEMNRRLESALTEAETSRLRLDTVLSSIDAGVMILSPEGRVLRANRAARELLGVPEDVTLAWTAPAVLDSVPREGDAEVRLDDASGTARTLAVSRRTLDPATRDEVVHVADVSRRTREIEERHRLEKLAEVLKTLGVLSHKINNPLTSLLGRAQILMVKKDLDPQVTKAAAVISESAGRIAELIRELALVVKEGRQEAVEKLLEMHPAGGEEGGRS